MQRRGNQVESRVEKAKVTKERERTRWRETKRGLVEVSIGDAPLEAELRGSLLGWAVVANDGVCAR